MKDIPRIGMGCWAIGGHFHSGGTPLGWHGADETASRRTLQAALDAGVRLFDTAAAYGAGRSERLVGEIIGNRPEAYVVTKFGPVIDEDTREILGEDVSPEGIRKSALASRERLKRDRIDLLLCHQNQFDLKEAPSILDTLETLRNEGVIGAYGWSTDFPQRLDAVASSKGFAAVEHAMNVFFDAASISQIAAKHELMQLIRSPLAMGVLTGKFVAGQRIPEGDIRSNTMAWMDYFKDGVVSADHIERLSVIRELLQTGGRTVGQGALCWLLAKSSSIYPLPGAKSEVQVRENFAALEFGPLPQHVMDEIEGAINRSPEGEARER